MNEKENRTDYTNYTERKENGFYELHIQKLKDARTVYDLNAIATLDIAESIENSVFVPAINQMVFEAVQKILGLNCKTAAVMRIRTCVIRTQKGAQCGLHSLAGHFTDILKGNGHPVWAGDAVVFVPVVMLDDTGVDVYGDMPTVKIMGKPYHYMVLTD